MSPAFVYNFGVDQFEHPETHVVINAEDMPAELLP